MTTTYSDTFRLNKPDFRSSPWSSQLNENTDKIDELFYRLMQANAIEAYAPVTLFEAGTIVFDSTTVKLWINSVTHTTVNDTFAIERATNSSYWAALNLGLDVKGQWQNDTFYAVNAMAYDATQGLSGICKIEHTSGPTGSMRDEIANWGILVDAIAGSGVPATGVSYDDTGKPFSGPNVQSALDGTNGRIDTINTTLNAATAAISALQILTAGLNDAVAALQNKATVSDIRAGAPNKYMDSDTLWDAAEFVDLGNVSGDVTIDFNTGLNFKMIAVGNTVIKNPTNLKNGQSLGLLIAQDGVGGRTITLDSQFATIGISSIVFSTSAGARHYISGQRVDASSVICSGGRIGP